VNSDFSDMLSALSAEGADFLVVGAYAVAAHGHPRATGDLDLWVRPSAENAARVMDALRRFGAPLFDLAEADLARPDIVFQLGIVPRRIDILTAISGVSFEEAWSERVELPIAGMTLPFIGREHLLRNKRATGRTQDRADVEALSRGR
jgi:hypothetical protein